VPNTYRPVKPALRATEENEAQSQKNEGRKEALNPNFLNFTINREKFCL